MMFNLAKPFDVGVGVTIGKGRPKVVWNDASRKGDLSFFSTVFTLQCFFNGLQTNQGEKIGRGFPTGRRSARGQVRLWC